MAQLAAVPSMDDLPMLKKSKRWTQEDLANTAAGKSTGHIRNKGRYGNVNKIEEDGIRFDSKREYLRYKDLKLLERAGEIMDLEVHPSYDIIIGGVAVMVSSNQHNKWDRQLRYEADFQYWRHDKPHGQGHLWKLVIEDVKMQSGHRTGVYKIKRALMRSMGYDIEEY